PVHLTAIHGHSEGGGREDIHGRQGALDGQCLHRAALAVAEIRVRLSAPIRERHGGAQWDRSVDAILRHTAPAFGAAGLTPDKAYAGATRLSTTHAKEQKKQQQEKLAA